MRSAAETIAHRGLRAFKKRQRLTYAHMAARTNYAERTLRWENSRGWPSRRVRVAVEDALGCPIFSTPAAFQLRQEQKRLLGGLCPVFASRKELRALAKRIGVVNAPGYPNRRELLRDLLARAAAVHRPLPATSSTPHHD